MGLIADFRQRKDIDAFASELASVVVRRLPIEHDEKKLRAEIDIALGHAQGFQRMAHLGTYGKARLVNGLQWALIEKGYKSDVARRIGYEIAARIAAPKAKDGKKKK